MTPWESPQERIHSRPRAPVSLGNPSFPTAFAGPSAAFGTRAVVDLFKSWELHKPLPLIHMKL